MKTRITNDLKGGSPSIDVIIPFHIIHEYLEQAIMSALESVGVRLRLLLVDDSNAIHPKWLTEISKFENVEIIKNHKKGYLGAMESGVRNIRSQYIGFLDSDDLTDRFRFHNQIKYMQENRLEICSSSILRIDSCILHLHRALLRACSLHALCRSLTAQARTELKHELNSSSN